MIIKKINLFFNLNNKYIFYRNCCNNFFSRNKYNDHLTFCETNKTMILMSSRNKYLEFWNIKNTIKIPFILFADIESYMMQKTIKNQYIIIYLGLLFTLYKRKMFKRS